MLWNQIYEFFVKYIFGGRLANNQNFSATMPVHYVEDGSINPTNTAGIIGLNLTDVNGDEVFLTFGNYLSLIATIITIVAIVLLCVWFIKKIIQIIFRLFTANGAF